MSDGATTVERPGAIDDLVDDGVDGRARGAVEPLPAWTPRKRRRRRPVAVWIAAGWLVLIGLLALLAPLLPLTDPNELTGVVFQRPGFRLDEPLGTDGLGRSILSRIVYGGRVSLAVGAAATALALVVGGVLGLLAGYFRSWVDSIFDVLTNAMLAFPPLIFLIAVAAIVSPSVTSLIFSLAVVTLPLFARVARANSMSFMNREFVLAGRAMGARHRRIMFREILPNMVLPLLSFGLTYAAALIVAEGSLSFLGLGIRPPTPSWGVMISEARSRLRTDPHGTMVPAVVFFLTVLALNTVGDHARARLGGVES
jgi:peptide/nickel transport system permease protein